MRKAFYHPGEAGVSGSSAGFDTTPQGEKLCQEAARAAVLYRNPQLVRLLKHKDEVGEQALMYL